MTSVFQDLETYTRLGKHDDHRDGAVLTKIAQGKLVRIPVPVNVDPFFAGDGGSTSAASTVTANNPEATGRSWLLNTGAAYNSGAGFECTLWGRVIGIRMSRANTAFRFPLAALVDGEPVKVRRVKTRNMLGALSASLERESLHMVIDDLLTDGPHQVRVILPGDPTGAQAHSAEVFGFVVEADKGYVEQRSTPFIPSTYDQLTVPTTRTSINLVGMGISSVQFANQSTTTARTATLYRGSNVYWRKTLAALAAGSDSVGGVTFPETATSAGWSWAVDAGTDVTGTVIVGRVLA